MRGRQAPGPEFVQLLPGDAIAKGRLEVILHIVAGTLSVQAAAATLGVSTQRLHRLRVEALQASIEQLTPRPSGRPRKQATPEQQRIAGLEAEVERLRRELAASQLRTEIAVLLPARPERVEKKTMTAKSAGVSAARVQWG
jgi:Winged helix-turn helix